MEHHLDRTIALLTRTPSALDVLLRGLPDEWVLHNEGEGTWSAFGIVGHLIHADRADWMVRLDWIFTCGESAPFPPFDRSGHVHSVAGKTMGQLLDDFAAERKHQLAKLDSFHLEDADLRSRGLHPALGAVTMSQLLATWAAHDLNHLHQLSRVMAHQYRELVWPCAQ